MGVYYGIRNNTKGVSVSYYWKGDENCDCHMVMHRYRWEIDDKIYSASHEGVFVFIHNEENNTMLPVYPDEYFHLDGNECLPKEFQSDEEIEEKIKVGFNYKKSQLKMTKDHAPIWKGNQCVVCLYEHDPSVLKKDRKLFDSTFFMS